MRRVNDEVLALGERALRLGMLQLVWRALRPVRLDAYPELILGADRRVGDGLPETVRRGTNVDLEHLLHRALQFAFQPGQTGDPGLGVLAHPPVMDEADGDRIDVVQLLSTSAAADHQTRV